MEPAVNAVADAPVKDDFTTAKWYASIKKYEDKNTCGCCRMPLWAAALVIGLSEFITYEQQWYLGFHEMAMFFFWNSIWFALLFIPGLFYSVNYRRAVLIVYSVSTVLTFIAAFTFTVICLVSAKHLPRDFVKIFESAADQSDGSWTAKGGPKPGFESQLAFLLPPLDINGRQG